MAGKSGTAQVFSVAQEEEYDEEEIEERLRDHALFISFAPVENPQIAVAVIVENGSSGSRVAAPIAQSAIMDQYLGYATMRLSETQSLLAGGAAPLDSFGRLLGRLAYRRAAPDGRAADLRLWPRRAV